MGESARITETGALRGFVPALVEFRDDALAGLMTAEATASRMADWVRNDRLPHWKRQIQRRQELVTRARSFLESKRPLNPDEQRSTVDAELALRKARRELAHAEAKLQETQRWVRVVDKALEEFRGATSGLSWYARADSDRAIGALNSMADAIDAYLAVGGPDSGRPAPTLPEDEGEAPSTGGGGP